MLYVENREEGSTASSAWVWGEFMEEGMLIHKIAEEMVKMKIDHC